MPRLGAQSRKTPGRLGMVALHTTLATAVRMVHRVHSHSANRGPFAMPARATRLSVSHVLVIEITDLADGGHAIDSEPAHFARGQLDQRQIAFLAEQLRRAARGAHHLRALTWSEFQVMHLCSGRT